jgi:hypothetical protein
MGIGVKTTPTAFVQSCEIFTFTENIVQEAIIEKQLEVPSAKKENKRQKAPVKTAAEAPKFSQVKLDLIDRAYFMATPADTGILVAVLGTNLRKIDPSFDTRAHGFQTLTRLLESLDQYEIYKPDSNGLSQPFVRRKQRGRK